MCPNVADATLLIKIAVPLIGWAGLYYVMVWRPRRKAREAQLLAEYDELMHKQGFKRSNIGKTLIWIPR